VPIALLAATGLGDELLHVIIEVVRIERAVAEGSSDFVWQGYLFTTEAGPDGHPQVEARLDMAKLRALYEAVEGGCDLGASKRFGTVMVFSSEDGAARGPLRAVVVQRNRRVIQK
jgi:hypothetical protein